jgi:serine/threonine-protein kinase HipA
MKRNCLYCYKPLPGDESGDFHPACSRSIFGDIQSPVMPYRLDEMEELAKKLVESHVTVPGVQPKISLRLIRDTLTGKKGRLTIVDAMGGNYIFKPPSAIYPEMPANEHLTMRIAEAFDIRVVPSTLIRLASGELSYITKRIDRTAKGQKIHMLDMFQITEASDKYRSSMERVGKAIGQYSSRPGLDKVFFFELTLFCFLTGNNDMHLKYFSLIRDETEWVLSPAYDLLNVRIANPSDDEDLALSLDGKKKKLKRVHFEDLGSGLDLNSRQIDHAFHRMQEARPLAEEWIDHSFLSPEYQHKYKEVLYERYTRLTLSA